MGCRRRKYGGIIWTLTCPTLVSVAEHDILAPPRFAREVAAAVPKAERRVIEAAAHAYFWERPRHLQHHVPRLPYQAPHHLTPEKARDLCPTGHDPSAPS